MLDVILTGTHPQTELVYTQAAYITALEEANVSLTERNNKTYKELTVAVAKAALKGAALKEKLLSIEMLEESLDDELHATGLIALEFQSKLGEYQRAAIKALANRIPRPPVAANITENLPLAEAKTDVIVTAQHAPNYIDPQVELMLQVLKQ